MTAVHTLTAVPLRDIWPRRGHDFIPWLAENADLLGEALHMDLELVGVDVAVGSFSADLVFMATDRNRRVVVENRLEHHDDEHLGKLIKYPTGVNDAGYGVLIADRLGPKHRSALTWLNSVAIAHSGFFGIEVQAFRIGNSPPAIRLDVVVEPDGWVRTVVGTPVDLRPTTSPAIQPGQPAAT